jgi:hypothetical protein
MDSLPCNMEDRMRKLIAGKLLCVASSIIHPILFAVFPVFFLYAHNVSEASTSQLLKPMLFLSLGALILWLLLSLLLKNTLKAGLATTIFVVLFSFYGRFYDLLVNWHSPLAKHAYLIPTSLLLWGYCTYFISVVRVDLKCATRILNVAATALVLVNVASIALYEIRKADQQSVVGSVIAMESSESGTMPDIYYIILDEYAHPSTMLEYYDYDNTHFVEELVDMGFYVASNSTVTYPATWICVSSPLNMEHFHDRQTREFYYESIAESAVARCLRSIGYTYVYFGSGFDAGRYKVDADVYYNFYESSVGTAAVSDFSRILWNATAARPFYDYLTGSIWEEHYRSALLETIQGLERMPYVEGPKFVFVHMMCPHIPFVFGPNGEHVDPAHWYDHRDKQFYLGQYRFITEQIKGVVTTLLEESNAPPIIILQSDHGLRSWVSGWAGVDEGEWQKVLNAYYLPGDAKNDLHDSISPNNSFRVIFNHYFGADYDLLED